MDWTRYGLDYIGMDWTIWVWTGLGMNWTRYGLDYMGMDWTI